MEDASTRLSRPLIASGAGALLLVGGLGWLWIERTPIATSYIDDALKARNVPASYRLTEVGFRTQRIEGIRIGDPRKPNLTADWAEVELAVGLGGVSVKAIDAGGVRLHGRLVDGKVSLGTIDRLLPKSDSSKPSKPFELPDIGLTARAMRFDVETPQGLVRGQLDGAGNLRDGFKGTLGLAADRIEAGECRAEALSARLGVKMDGARPTIRGPLQAARILCPQASLTAPLLAIDATGDRDLMRWRGNVAPARGRLVAGALSVDRFGGQFGFDASPDRVSGRARLTTGAVHQAGSSIRNAAFDADYRFDPKTGVASAEGKVRLVGARLDPAQADAMVASLASADATPVGPVLTAWGEALRRASRSVDASAGLIVNHGPQGGGLRVGSIDARAIGGGHLLIRSEQAEGIGWRWPRGGLVANGSAELSGGGLPRVLMSLRQAVPGAPLSGSATIAPYQAGGARFALSPIQFGPGPRGSTLISTRVTMDGPLADGRVEGLDMPVSAMLRGKALVVNPDCAPLEIDRLAIAGTVIGKSRLRLCPIEGAMFGLNDKGIVYGGAGVADLRLRGRVGDQPLTMTARSLAVQVGRPGFAVDALAVRLGDPAEPTRLDIVRLDGRLGSAGMAGSFTGADGKIGVVPLLLSGGEGRWTLTGGVLKLDGALDVDDAQTTAPRFNRLRVPDVALALNGGYITTTGTLTEPTTGTPVSKLRIAHSLQGGRGDATLDVPGLRFTKGLQPETLTPLTLGIVANVEGEVAGQGKIVWAGGNVTSTGAFRTEGLNLAAAFGPVTGLKGTINFTDLLAMETAPDQVVTVEEINPGIAVTKGVIRYRLLSGQRLDVTSAIWPLAGGTLSLDPTLLDFGQPVERRMLFRIDGLDAGSFIQQLEFKNIAVTGKFDGLLPIIFDARGGRIEGGVLRVRPGGGTLSYVGDVTNANLGTMARIAFDALKSMRYSQLVIDLNGSLDGEIVSRVNFDGTNNAPKEERKNKGLLARFIAPITRLPFRFNITIRAPFRGLVASAQTFVDPSIVLRNVPVQPQAAQPANPLPDPVPAPIQPR